MSEDETAISDWNETHLQVSAGLKEQKQKYISTQSSLCGQPPDTGKKGQYYWLKNRLDDVILCE